MKIQRLSRALIQCFAVVVIGIILCFTGARSANADTRPELCRNEPYVNAVRQIWQIRKPDFTLWLQQSGDNPSNLYNFEFQAHAMVSFIRQCNDYDLLDDFLKLLPEAVKTLKTRDTYNFYYRSLDRVEAFPLERTSRMWLNKKYDVGQEAVLSSAQFLALVSDVAAIVAQVPEDHRTQLEANFLAIYLPVLLDHYERWIVQPGVFQVRGWACTIRKRPVKTGQSHFEFIQRKLNRTLGDASAPSYCNSVTDTDMWIFAGLSNLIAAEKRGQLQLPLPARLRSTYDRYIALSYTLMQDRITFHSTKNFSNQDVTTAIFDEGIWRDHDDYRVAGLDTIMSWNPSIAEARDKVPTIGMDLSHASRLVQVLSTLQRNQSAFDTDFPTNETLKAFANQMSYVLFNRDFKKPLFANFMDGSNGWYRINYSGRKEFGYPPYSFSIAMLYGGFGLWSEYNEDLAEIYAALYRALRSDDPEIRQHIDKYYNRYFYNNGARQRAYHLEKSDPKVFVVLLPSLVHLPEYLLDASLFEPLIKPE